MPVNDWSDDIVIAKLSDEPTFSEEIQNLLKQLEEVSGDYPDVIVDMQEVTFLNSSNIAQLLRLRNVVAQKKKRLRICSVNDQVWSMLIMAGLDKIFSFNDNVATSLASLQIESA